MTGWRNFFFYTLLFLGTLLILITMGSLIAEERYWWIKVLDFPRIQVLILALVVLVFFLFITGRGWGVGKYAFVAGLAATIALQSFYLYPYTRMAAEKVETVAMEAADPQATVSVMVANVKISNRRYRELLAIVNNADPDLVLAIETNRWWENVLQPLDEEYPYAMEYPLENGYGMLLYSKFPLLDQQIKFLAYDSVPSFHANVKLPNGRLFGFHSVHPVPPYPHGKNQLKQREIALVKVGEMVEASDLPAVVAGDLNDVSWAQRETLFEEKGKLQDTRIGRGIYPTFNARNPVVRWPLDYVFVTEDFGLVALERLPDFGSDHFPFYTKLVLKPHNQVGLKQQRNR
jgi:endonuclease/exonuclease/phosphatase (EEP) superfamily protein YafD